MSRSSLPWGFPFAALLLLLVGGCVKVIAVDVKSNGEVLLDAMEEHARISVKKLGFDERTRVAVVDLDGDQGEDSYPSALVRDMLVDALSDAGITVVERDVDGLATAMMESVGDSLPLTIERGDQQSEELPDGRPLSRRLDMASAVAISAAEGPATTSLTTANRVLEYRILQCGVWVGLDADEEVLRRKIRVELLIRVVEPEHGIVLWSDRVVYTTEGSLPPAAERVVGLEKYVFYPPRERQQPEDGDGAPQPSFPGLGPR